VGLPIISTPLSFHHRPPIRTCLTLAHGSREARQPWAVGRNVFGVGADVLLRSQRSGRMPILSVPRHSGIAARHPGDLHHRASRKIRSPIIYCLMLQNYLYVAVGGTLGVLARYGMQVGLYTIAPRGFPYATIVVNVVGCFVIGVVMAAANERGVISPDLRLLLTTGFCGGFTTFSTFTYETIALFSNGEAMYAILYSGCSLLLGFAATVAGLVVGRMM
jgi:CrcB protein